MFTGTVPPSIIVIPGAAPCFFCHPGRRPGIPDLAAAPERASNVIRAGWIPACAGMTIRGADTARSLVIPGADPGSTVSRQRPSEPQTWSGPSGFPPAREWQ